MRVSAIILAAGESRRMGTQKALLDWHGLPLVDYQLEQLRSLEAVTEVIVVTGHDPAAIEAIVGRHPKARSVQNDAYMTGKVSSILAGLSAVSADNDAILFCAVDQPRSAKTVRSILTAHKTGRRAITIPTYGGHRGHPLVFDAALLSELLAIDEESMGIRAVVERDPSRVHEYVTNDSDVLLDMNAPSDIPAHNRPA